MTLESLSRRLFKIELLLASPVFLLASHCLWHVYLASLAPWLFPPFKMQDNRRSPPSIFIKGYITYPIVNSCPEVPSQAPDPSRSPLGTRHVAPLSLFGASCVLESPLKPNSWESVTNPSGKLPVS